VDKHPGISTLVGITGGLGSGKSTVSKIFESLGAFRIDSDAIARRFTDADSPVRKEIQEIFGLESFPESSIANRADIAKQAFNDIKKRSALNQLIHPLVRAKFLEELAAVPEGSVVAWEVPLLFETKGNLICDFTICVYLPIEKAWLRVKERGGIPREDFDSRVASQIDIYEKKSLSDYVIQNDTPMEELEKSVLEIFQDIKNRAKVQNERENFLRNQSR
jgi:dephospho-CoA kinase